MIFIYIICIMRPFFTQDLPLCPRLERSKEDDFLSLTPYQYTPLFI